MSAISKYYKEDYLDNLIKKYDAKNENLQLQYDTIYAGVISALGKVLTIHSHGNDEYSKYFNNITKMLYAIHEKFGNELNEFSCHIFLSTNIRYESYIVFDYHPILKEDSKYDKDDIEEYISFYIQQTGFSLIYKILNAHQELANIVSDNDVYAESDFITEILKRDYLDILKMDQEHPGLLKLLPAIRCGIDKTMHSKNIFKNKPSTATLIKMHYPNERDDDNNFIDNNENDDDSESPISLLTSQLNEYNEDINDEYDHSHEHEHSDEYHNEENTYNNNEYCF